MMMMMMMIMIWILYLIAKERLSEPRLHTEQVIPELDR
jgi:hypothetical protein